jgi:hypothetical protein
LDCSRPGRNRQRERPQVVAAPAEGVGFPESGEHRFCRVASSGRIHGSRIRQPRLLLGFRRETRGTCVCGQPSFGRRPHKVATPRRQAWVFGALVVGVTYLLIGLVFSVPSTPVRAWRLAAWMVSAVVYGAHITYECVQARNAPRAVALHAAFAAALGALGLAVVGALHSLWTTSAVRPVWFLAFVLWPIITGLPAFVVAFGPGRTLHSN